MLCSSARCSQSVNHTNVKHNAGHDKKCKYQHQLENKLYLCKVYSLTLYLAGDGKRAWQKECILTSKMCHIDQTSVNSELLTEIKKRFFFFVFAKRLIKILPDLSDTCIKVLIINVIIYDLSSAVALNQYFSMIGTRASEKYRTRLKLHWISYKSYFLAQLTIFVSWGIPIGFCPSSVS